MTTKTITTTSYLASLNKGKGKKKKDLTALQLKKYNRLAKDKSRKNKEKKSRIIRLKKTIDLYNDPRNRKLVAKKISQEDKTTPKTIYLAVNPTTADIRMGKVSKSDKVALKTIGKEIGYNKISQIKQSFNPTEKNYLKKFKGYNVFKFGTQAEATAFLNKFEEQEALYQPKTKDTPVLSAGKDAEKLSKIQREKEIKDFQLEFVGGKKYTKYSAQTKKYILNYDTSTPSSKFDGVMTALIRELIKANKIKKNDKFRIEISDVGGAKHFSSKWLKPKDNFDIDANNFVQSIAETDDGIEWGDDLVVGLEVVNNPYANGRGTTIHDKSKIYSKRSIIQIKNDDDLCLGRCIMLSQAKLNKHPQYESIRKQRALFTQLTHKLYEDCGVEKEISDLDSIKQFEEALNLCITIIDGDNFNNVIYPNTEDKDYQIKDNNVYLYKTGNHFDLIACDRVAGFFGKNFWCEKCKKCYCKKGLHKCKFKCNMCCGSCDSAECEKKWRKCEDCNRNFPSDICFNNHKNSNCDKFFKCNHLLCGGKLFNTEKFNKDNHIHGEYWCYNCKAKVDKDHKCYLQPKHIKKSNDKYIYFDFEATTNEDLEHEVMFCVAQYNYSDENFIFEDRDTFCKWLFSEQHKNHTIVAHNGRGYDFQFILRYIYQKTTYKPFIIYNGTKIMTFSIKQGLNIRFVDSLNFLTMRLADFPKTFGIKELKKGYFPHLFNKPQNYQYVGEIPDKKYFAPNSFSPEGRKDFLKWWSNKKDNNYEWRQATEMEGYCISDVDILKKGCEAFREIFKGIADIDPLQYTTIASVCMTIFRANYIIEDYSDKYWDAKEVGEEEKFQIDTSAQVKEEGKIGVFKYEDTEFIRKSFFGGRTNATKLVYNFKGEEEGRYADITSLYPSVNYFDEYPLGHHEIIEKDFDYTIKSYFGFVECEITPPKGLYFPVLAHKGEKLFFDLKKQKGTWATPELNKALEKGYKINNITKVFHYKRTTRSLFKGYIEKFLKIKQESSGFPSWCKCEKDKQEYITDYHTRQGIKLDYDKIQKNKGLRATAKLCLNSLWGKFGQRTNLKKTEVISEGKRFSEIMFDEKYDNQNFTAIDDERMEIQYRMKDEYVDNATDTNISIASFTTSHARMRLYWGLDLLDRQVLYHDTDSVVYAYDKTNPNHKSIPCGDLLGDWTDELEGAKMIGTFVGAGPKNYSYETDDGEYHTKIKGFTLNWEAQRKLNHASMLDLVLNRHDYKKEDYTIDYFMIGRNKEKQLHSFQQKKAYGFCYDKRKILDADENGNIDTLPFGF